MPTTTPKILPLWLSLLGHRVRETDMSTFYMKFSPTHQPIDWVERPVPFEGFNAKDDSAVNGKPYWVEAVRQGFEPFDAATQVRTGPVLQPSPAVIRWMIRPKTAAELNAEQAARVEGHISPAILALAKHAGLTRAQLRPLIEVELP